MLSAYSNMFNQMSSMQLIKILEENKSKKASSDDYWPRWLHLFNRDFPALLCFEPDLSDIENTPEGINRFKAEYYESVYRQVEHRHYLNKISLLLWLANETEKECLHEDAREALSDLLVQCQFGNPVSPAYMTKIRQVYVTAVTEMASSTDAESAFATAICHNNLEALNLLIEAGADASKPDEYNIPPILYAIEANNISIKIIIALLQEMIKKQAISRRYESGTVLDGIIQSGKLQLINAITEQFSDVALNTFDNLLWTAVKSNNSAIVSYLLTEHKLDPNMLVANISPILFQYLQLRTKPENRGGYIGRSNYDPKDMTLLGALIDAGAQLDINIRSHNMTPLMYAESQNDAPVVQFLKERAAATQTASPNRRRRLEGN